MLTVRDYMHADPMCAEEGQTMREAIEVFRKHNFRHLPIVNKGVLVGIVTDRDIKRASPSLLMEINQEEYEQILDNTPVSRIMTRSPITVTPDTFLKSAAQILVDKKIGGLPVVNGPQLVGVITETDFLRALCDLLDKFKA